MRHLAILIGLGWFWLTFYSVGPLTSGTQLAVGGLSLSIGCVLSALWGAAIGARRRCRPSVRPGSLRPGAPAGLRR